MGHGDGIGTKADPRAVRQDTRCEPHRYEQQVNLRRLSVAVALAGVACGCHSSASRASTPTTEPLPVRSSFKAGASANGMVVLVGHDTHGAPCTSLVASSAVKDTLSAHPTYFGAGCTEEGKFDVEHSQADNGSDILYGLYLKGTTTISLEAGTTVLTNAVLDGKTGSFILTAKLPAIYELVALDSHGTVIATVLSSAVAPVVPSSVPR